MVIYCGCRACEWYDRGKCSKVIGDTPACEEGYEGEIENNLPKNARRFSK